MKSINDENGAGLFRSGFIALLGRPNVGKSTLLNRLVGSHLAIATPMPQTTRLRLRAVLHRPRAQLVFVDTPGLHRLGRRSRHTLNRRLNQWAAAAAHDADALVLLIECGGRGFTTRLEDEDLLVLRVIEKARRPALLLANKLDLLTKDDDLERVTRHYLDTGLFAGALALSAKTGQGCDEHLLQSLENLLPAGPPYFPPDTLTDQPERLLAAERVREQIILNTGQEVPFSTAVVVESFRQRQDMIVVQAVIYVERASQKGIVIGRGGRKLRQIGTLARQALENFFSKRVWLDLHVKVKRDWSRSERGLHAVELEQP